MDKARQYYTLIRLIVILCMGLGVIGIGVYWVGQELFHRLTDSSDIYSGWYYSNAEYGFQMELPESWVEINPVPAPEADVVAQFYFEKRNFPDAYFNVIITTETAQELGLAGVTLLDQSNDYYFYYSVPTQQADCSATTDVAEQDHCTRLQDIIGQDIQNGIIKTFTLMNK